MNVSLSCVRECVWICLEGPRGIAYMHTSLCVPTCRITTPIAKMSLSGPTCPRSLVSGAMYLACEQHNLHNHF